jgi:DNA polymerase-3 subunit epsilon
MSFIDLETTGNRYYTDRILEFSVLKLYPDGREEYKSRRVNPEMPISKEATEKHGITSSVLEGEPIFKQLAKGICDFLDDCDLSGFNILGFDLPVLEREFERSGIEFSRWNRQIVDSMSIYHMREPFNPPNSRDLAAAYRKFCGKELTGAHRSESDVRASAEILDGQLEVYSDLPCDVNGLCSLCLEHRKAFIDIGGRLVWLENGEAGFNFGKHKGYTLRSIAHAHPDYLIWILNQDFSPEVKDIITKALEDEYPQNI